MESFMHCSFYEKYDCEAFLMNLKYTCLFFFFLLISASYILNRNTCTHTYNGCMLYRQTSELSLKNKGKQKKTLNLSMNTYYNTLVLRTLLYLLYTEKVISQLKVQKTSSQTSDLKYKKVQLQLFSSFCLFIWTQIHTGDILNQNFNSKYNTPVFVINKTFLKHLFST